MKLMVIIDKFPKGLMSVASMLLIVYLSLDDNPFEADRVLLFEGADKVAHCLMYAFLTLILALDFSKFYRNIGAMHMGICALFAFAFSVLMEYLQGAMNMGRSFSLTDMIANFVGIFFGFLLALSFLRKLLRSAGSNFVRKKDL